jgi:DNA-binding NtrC family response regulator
MATTLLLGTDDGLLEGLAQAFGADGHRAVVARSIDDAVSLAVSHSPLVVVVEHRLAADPEFARLRLPAGAALVVFRSDDEVTRPLPGPIQRATLAELVLPWERHRLITLVRRVEERARASGRERPQTPPENRAV